MMRGRRLVLPLAAALALSACGGGGERPSRPGTPGNPLQSTLTPKTASGRSNEAAGTPAARQQAASTPCGLVSRAQASSILGERVRKPQPGVQGPTGSPRIWQGCPAASTTQDIW